MVRLKSNLFLLACCAVFVSCSGQKPSVESASGGAVLPEVQLISWSDFHSAIYESKVDDTRAEGGLPAFMTAVEAAKGEGLNLLIDGGDMFQGAQAFNESKGMGMIDVMNALGLDVSTLGNHEFDFGSSAKYPDDPRGAQREAVLASQFTWVNANVVTSDGHPALPVKPYTLVEKGPYRIAVIGLISQETPVATSASNVVGLEFRSPARVLQEVLPEVVALKPDMVVVNAHVTGLPQGAYAPGQVIPNASFDGEIGELLALPPEVLGQVDLLLTGHSHQSFIAFSGDLPVIQSHSGGREFTTMTLRSDGKKLRVVPETITKHVLSHVPMDATCGETQKARTLVEVDGKMLQPSPVAYDLIARYESRMKENRCEVVACLDAFAKHTRVGETVAGNLLTDSMRHYHTRAQVALLNAGALRIDLPEGALYRETINSLMPFDNKVYLIEVLGEDILRALKLSSTMLHGTTQVSGLSYQVEPDCSNPEDINGDGQVEGWENNCLCAGAQMEGQSIDPKATYRVALSDFMFHGGDHHSGIFRSAKVMDEGVTAKQMILSYLQGQTDCIRTSQVVQTEAPRIQLASCQGNYQK